NFARRSSRESIFLRKSSENGLCLFSGPHTEKLGNVGSRGAVLPLREESKEDTSSLANLWFLSFRQERNLGRGLSKPVNRLCRVVPANINAVLRDPRPRKLSCVKKVSQRAHKEPTGSLTSG